MTRISGPAEKTQHARRTTFADGSATATEIPSNAVGRERLKVQRDAVAFASVPIAAVMTQDVVCVAPDLAIEALTALLIERGISGVPVVDAGGKPIGIVSKTDLVRRQHEEGWAGSGIAPSELERGLHEEPPRECVADYMLPVAFTLREDAPLSHAAALMAWEGVHRVPVCSADGDVVGIVTALDIVRWVADNAGYPAPK